MRHFFILATLVFFAVPLAAQESGSADAGETGASLVEGVIEAPAAGQAEAPVVTGLEIGGFEIELQEAAVQVESLEEVEAAVRQPDQRNWWWLVGAIVTAGVILAVVL